MKIAAFASGNGSNINALIEKGIKIDVIICNNPQAFVIERASEHNVDCVVITTKNRQIDDYEAEMYDVLKKYEIELIVLAGYMKLVGPTLLNEYAGNIINIHPSLLPAFKGARAIEDAFKFGVKISGVTIHYIDSELDSGTIIMQEAVPIYEGESFEQFKNKIHNVEYNLYYKAINKIIEERNEKSTN